MNRPTLLRHTLPDIMLREAEIVRGYAKVFPAAGAHNRAYIMPVDEEVLRRADAE